MKTLFWEILAQKFFLERDPKREPNPLSRPPASPQLGGGIRAGGAPHKPRRGGQPRFSPSPISLSLSLVRDIRYCSRSYEYYSHNNTYHHISIYTIVFHNTNVRIIIDTIK